VAHRPRPGDDVATAALCRRGLFQYLSPTIQFLLGVWLFREPFGSARFAGFVLIWIALALYSLDGWRRRTTRVVAAEG
jgi:EamA domain-containing membrane protein RarD